MPAQQLLEISPDKLFEEYGISQIQGIQVQLQNEIEKKREELRTMVGERYRDLLKAADTITEMKETSRNVIDHINHVKTLCQALQGKRLIGFKQIDKQQKHKFSDDVEDVSKIIEIKILLSLPEQIWSAIDDKEYLLAAQLFLLATHVHLGIEVSPKADKLLTKFPVLAKQWAIISGCRKIIIDGAKQELGSIDLSFEKTSKCLSCLVLLEVMSHDKLIMQYLELRIKTLSNVLQSDHYPNVKQKLKATVILIQQTLASLYFCFLDESENNCSICKELEEITSETAKPTLTKMKQIISLPENYLSPLITDFRPKTSNSLVKVSQEIVRQKLEEWLPGVEKLLERELTLLLDLIVDINRLHKINIEVEELDYPKGWEDVVENLLGCKTLNIYDRFIKSYVTKRVIKLIETVWGNSVNTVVSCLKKTDEDLRKERIKQPENDIRWFVWKEDKNDTEECLRLKTQGYTFRVMELCKTLDLCLAQLLDEVELYVGKDVLSGTKTDVESNFLEIAKYLNLCSFQMLKKLTEIAKSKGKTLNDSSVILRCRFLQSLITHCPNLEKCLRPRQVQGSHDNRNGNSWQQACSFLHEESIKMWRMWKELTVIKLNGLIKDKLSSKVSLRNLLTSKPLSEVITIEEQTEDGSNVKSDIRVPSQPSLPLQDVLFQTCQILNSVMPHTLPKCIHEELIDAFVKGLLNHYEMLSKCDPIYQSQAWQMLLDIRLLTLLLVTRENKDTSQLLCETLEKMIDPFDLDVYYPYLQNNVKKSAQKLQGTMGILINYSEKLPVFNGIKLTQSNPNSKVEESNILAMSNNIPRFSLLLVSDVNKRRTETGTSKEFSPGKTSSKIKDKESKKESASSDFVRSAGAFFGAMTGGWS